jgi:hypothetical protein
MNYGAHTYIYIYIDIHGVCTNCAVLYVGYDMHATNESYQADVWNNGGERGRPDEEGSPRRQAPGAGGSSGTGFLRKAEREEPSVRKHATQQQRANEEEDDEGELNEEARKNW